MNQSGSFLIMFLAGLAFLQKVKKTLYRLTELIVDWILANPTPILLGDVDYKR